MKRKFVLFSLLILIVFWVDIQKYLKAKYPIFQIELNAYLVRMIQSIPLIILFTFFTFLAYKYIILLTAIIQKVQDTELKIRKHFGNLQNIGVAGITGSHKTSSWVFFIQVLEAFKIEKMIRKINYIKNKLYYIDFYLINDYINKNLDVYKTMAEEDYQKLATEMLIHLGYHSLDKEPDMIDTAFKSVSIIRFMGDYIELYYILNLRGCNVVSNVAIYSENTGSLPFIIKENYFTIFKNIDFKLEKYMIVFDDENGVFNNYKKTMKKTAAAIDDNDDGKSEMFMLIRHAFDGTTSRIGIQQNLSDFIANQRRQYQAVLNMGNGNNEIVVYNFEKDLINRIIVYLDLKEIKYYHSKLKLLNRFKRPTKRYFKLAFKLNGYLDRPNLFKVIKARLVNILDFLENKEILVEHTSFYHNPEDIGKDVYRDNPGTKSLAYPLVFFVPKNRTWSYYDTYSYKNVFKKLKDQTNGSILTTRKFKSISVTADEFDSMNYSVFDKIKQKTKKVETTNTNPFEF